MSDPDPVSPHENVIVDAQNLHVAQVHVAAGNNTGMLPPVLPGVLTRGRARSASRAAAAASAPTTRTSSVSPHTGARIPMSGDGTDTLLPAAAVREDVPAPTCDDFDTTPSRDSPVSQLSTIDVVTQPSGLPQPVGSTGMFILQPQGMDTHSHLSQADTLLPPDTAVDTTSFSQQHDMTASCPHDSAYAHVTDTYLSTCVQQSYVIGTQLVHVMAESHNASKAFALHSSAPAPDYGGYQSSHTTTTYGHGLPRLPPRTVSRHVTSPEPDDEDGNLTSVSGHMQAPALSAVSQRTRASRSSKSSRSSRSHMSSQVDIAALMREQQQFF